MPTTWILPRNWWCYPVKPKPARTLDHTKFRGKNRARYPVRKFTMEECAAYVLQPWAGKYDFSEWEGCRGHVVEKRTITKWERQSDRQRADATELATELRSQCCPSRSMWRASIPAADRRFRFLGRLARRGDFQPTPYTEPRLPQGLFGEAQKLLTNIVISLRPAAGIAVNFGSWVRDEQGRVEFTPKPKRKDRRVPPVMDKYWHPSWRWKPDRQYYLDAWEQTRFVRWTRPPRPSMANLRAFLIQKSFLQHRVGT
jgi:hypothetical protein